MSEEDRSRLYAWFREHTDEPLAEYLMSCLAPAPLSDLVTKADLRSVKAHHYTVVGFIVALFVANLTIL
ncbi:hypothetical protein [Candidatus Poriferisodalis sp.]|uniref:hypothetical protein n=1 Tax=Candidatus Poriferisodalis sp. TaxID=3101277 RepID=UPI003B52CD6D